MNLIKPVSSNKDCSSLVTGRLDNVNLAAHVSEKKKLLKQQIFKTAHLNLIIMNQLQKTLSDVNNINYQ